MPLPANYVYPGVDHSAVLAAVKTYMTANPPTIPVDVSLIGIPYFPVETYQLDEKGCVTNRAIPNPDMPGEALTIPIVASRSASLTVEQAAVRSENEKYLAQVANALTADGKSLGAAGWPEGVGFGGPDVEAHLLMEV